MVPNVIHDKLGRLLVELVGEATHEALKIKRRDRKQTEIVQNVEIVVDDQIDRGVVTTIV